MRPIKFRGRGYFTGELYYGFYLVDEDGVSILEGRNAYLVEPDSIAQLVGYDSDGNEVYEGDTFVIPCGTEIPARLFDNITKNAKLKENQS